MWLFFYEPENRVEAEGDLGAEFDPRFAREMERRIRLGTKPVKRVVNRRGLPPREVIEYPIHGLVKWHGFNLQMDSMFDELFNVIAYNKRLTLSNGVDWYDVLVRFKDGVYQDLHLDVFPEPDPRENIVSVYPVSKESRETNLRKMVFRSEEDRQAYVDAELRSIHGPQR